MSNETEGPIPPQIWQEASMVTSKDRVSVVYDEELGAIAGNWVDGHLVATGADRSVLYPVKNMPMGVSLAVYIAHSHLAIETRVVAIEWLLEHDCPISKRLGQELEDWYKGVGEIP